MNEHSVNAAIDKLLFSNSRSFTFLLIIVACLIAYANAVNHPFVHDDIVFIQQNPQIDKLDLKGIFAAGPASAGSAGLINTYWRPGLELVYRLQYKAFGLNAAFYHLTNILLHGLNGILLFLLFDKLLLKNKGVALGGALIFLLHPIQSESVACVAGISNVLLAFFMFLSFFFYLVWLEKGGGLRAGCCLIALALALLVKEQAVVAPVIFLWHYFILGSRRRKGELGLLAGAFGAVAVYFALRYAVTGAVVTSRIAFDAELALRLASIPRTLLIYLRSLLWPADLHYYRNLDVLAAKIFPALWLALVAAGVWAAVARLKSEKRIAVFALGFSFLSLLPMLNIVPLINEYSLILTADHFLYIPIAGLALFALIVIDDMWCAGAGIKRAAFVLLCAAYLSLTVFLNSFWAAEVPLFERTVRYEKDFARGHYLLAKAYYFDGQFERSIGPFETALKIMQGYHDKAQDERAREFYKSFIKSINFDMAHSYTAMAQYRKALERYLKTLALDPHDGATYNNVGLAYVNLGEAALSEDFFMGALALDPNDTKARNNLATLYAIQGRVDEALAHFEVLLKAEPDNPVIMNNYNQLQSHRQETASPEGRKETE